MPAQAEPPVSCCRLTIAQIMKGSSDVTKNALDGCKAGRACAGADRELDGLEPSKPGLIAIYGGRGKGGNGTRTADDGDAALASHIVQSGDARDELPAVGKVDVVAASLNGGSGDPVVLLLERSRGVDQNLCSTVFQNAPEAAVVRVYCKRLLGAET